MSAPRRPSWVQIVPSGSAAMVRVGRGGRLELLRHGVNDAAFGADAAGYLRDLTRRWAVRAAPSPGPGR